MEPGGACRCPGCDVAHVRNLHLSEEAAGHLRDVSHPWRVSDMEVYTVLSWILFLTIWLPACSELPCHRSLADEKCSDDVCVEVLCWNDPDTIVLWLLFIYLIFLKVQTTIEELLSIGCETEPTSAKILFRDGFEKEGSDLLWQISSIYCDSWFSFMK